jgi:hypothetical protein
MTDPQHISAAATDLRRRLVEAALEWERLFGIAPAITSALSEYDAACLVGCPEAEFSAGRSRMTAVSRGYDFLFGGKRFQVKANRPSGKPGSVVTLVAKATNYEFDVLVWLLYDQRYNIVEAWQWETAAYQSRFDSVKRLSPTLMRHGVRVFPKPI